MTDEIVGGAAGRPRPGSRAGLVLAAAALFGYVVTHRYPAPPAQPAPAPPAPSPTIQAAPAEPHLAGKVGAGPAGLRLLADGLDPRMIDAHSQAVNPVPGLNLPAGATAQLLRLGPSEVGAVSLLYGAHGGMYLIRPGAKPLLLGADGQVIPGRDGGILLGVFRQGRTAVSGFTLQRQLRWTWEQPGHVLLLRDTPAGLVVAVYPDAVADDAELLVVDRRTGATVRRVGHIRRTVAISDQLVAWSPEHCDLACTVLVTDLSTGATRRFPVYRRPTLVGGAFSPDGRQLALSFAGVRADGTGPLEPGTVAILDLRTGRRQFVPELATPPPDHADVTWSADGRWLVLGVRYSQQERIALWRPGEGVIILPTELPGPPNYATLSVLT